VERLQNRYTAL